MALGGSGPLDSQDLNTLGLGGPPLNPPKILTSQSLEGPKKPDTDPNPQKLGCPRIKG